MEGAVIDRVRDPKLNSQAKIASNLNLIIYHIVHYIQKLLTRREEKTEEGNI